MERIIINIDVDTSESFGGHLDIREVQKDIISVVQTLMGWISESSIITSDVEVVNK